MPNMDGGILAIQIRQISNVLHYVNSSQSKLRYGERPHEWVQMIITKPFDEHVLSRFTNRGYITPYKKDGFVSFNGFEWVKTTTTYCHGLWWKNLITLSNFR